MSAKHKNTIGTRRLDDLVDFPEQHALFPADETASQDESLRASIAEYGLKHPIEVLPKNKAGYPPDTILSGHRRARALRALGHETTEVVIRRDLARVSRERIKAEFVVDNLDRRHLSPLGKARCIKALFDLERGRSRRQSAAGQDSELRDRVGNRIGMSGRNAQRYLDVLSAPSAVQEAFDAGRVKLDLAARVGTASEASQQEVETLIADGQPPNKAINAVVKPPYTRPKCWHRVLSRALGHFEDGIAKLDDVDLGSSSWDARDRELETVRATMAHCEALLEAAQRCLDRDTVSE